MSGGMDSSSVAAFAQETRQLGRHGSRVHVATGVFNRLLQDDEGPYAAAVGDFLDVPVQFVEVDDQ